MINLRQHLLDTVSALSFTVALSTPSFGTNVYLPTIGNDDSIESIAAKQMRVSKTVRGDKLEGATQRVDHNYSLRPIVDATYADMDLFKTEVMQSETLRSPHSVSKHKDTILRQKIIQSISGILTEDEYQKFLPGFTDLMFGKYHDRLGKSLSLGETTPDKDKMGVILSFTKNKKGNTSLFIKELGLTLPSYKDFEPKDLDDLTPLGVTLNSHQKVTANHFLKLYKQQMSSAVKKAIVQRLQNQSADEEGLWNILTGTQPVQALVSYHQTPLISHLVNVANEYVDANKTPLSPWREQVRAMGYLVGHRFHALVDDAVAFKKITSLISQKEFQRLLQNDFLSHLNKHRMSGVVKIHGGDGYFTDILLDRLLTRGFLWLGDANERFSDKQIRLTKNRLGTLGFVDELNGYSYPLFSSSRMNMEEFLPQNTIRNAHTDALLKQIRDYIRVNKMIHSEAVEPLAFLLHHSFLSVIDEVVRGKSITKLYTKEEFNSYLKKVIARHLQLSGTANVRLSGDNPKSMTYEQYFTKTVQEGGFFERFGDHVLDLVRLDAFKLKMAGKDLVYAINPQGALSLQDTKTKLYYPIFKNERTSLTDYVSHTMVRNSHTEALLDRVKSYIKANHMLHPESVEPLAFVIQQTMMSLADDIAEGKGLSQGFTRESFNRALKEGMSRHLRQAGIAEAPVNQHLTYEHYFTKTVQEGGFFERFGGTVLNLLMSDAANSREHSRGLVYAFNEMGDLSLQDTRSKVFYPVFMEDRLKPNAFFQEDQRQNPLVQPLIDKTQEYLNVNHMKHHEALRPLGYITGNIIKDHHDSPYLDTLLEAAALRHIKLSGTWDMRVNAGLNYGEYVDTMLLSRLKNQGLFVYSRAYPPIMRNISMQASMIEDNQRLQNEKRSVQVDPLNMSISFPSMIQGSVRSLPHNQSIQVNPLSLLDESFNLSPITTHSYMEKSVQVQSKELVNSPKGYVNPFMNGDIDGSFHLSQVPVVESLYISQNSSPLLKQNEGQKKLNSEEISRLVSEELKVEKSFNAYKNQHLGSESLVISEYIDASKELSDKGIQAKADLKNQSVQVGDSLNQSSSFQIVDKSNSYSIISNESH